MSTTTPKAEETNNQQAEGENLFEKEGFTAQQTIPEEDIQRAKDLVAGVTAFRETLRQQQQDTTATTTSSSSSSSSSVNDHVTNADSIPVPVHSDHLIVCVRKRPMHPHEAEANGTCHSMYGHPEYDCVTVQDPLVYLHDEEVAFGGIRTGKVAAKAFRVNHAFSESTTNDDVFATLKGDLVDFVSKGDGRVATCIAYGQTGSGKTFTQVALQRNCVSALFSEHLSSSEQQQQQQEPPYSIRVSFFENQGDVNYDLLNKRNECVLREDGEGVIHVIDLTTTEVKSLSEMEAVLQQANALRATHPTKNNPDSSRSHAICRISIVDNNTHKLHGMLQIVDLAGSERNRDVYEHTPERIKEMKDINWSLGCLKECSRMSLERELKFLKQLEKQQQNNDNDEDDVKSVSGYIPYRRSKLTLLLKDCFLDSSEVANKRKTIFISTLNPMNSHHHHTSVTLTYTTQLLAVEALKSEISNVKQQQQQQQDGKSAVKKISLPSKWSKTKFTKWLSGLDNGRFVKNGLIESMQLTGKSFSIIFQMNLIKRVEAAGCTEEDAIYVYDRFHELERDAKRALAKQKKKTSNKSGGSKNLKQFLQAGRRAPKKGEMFARKLGHVVKGGDQEDDSTNDKKQNEASSYSSSSYYLSK